MLARKTILMIVGKCFMLGIGHGPSGVALLSASRSKNVPPNMFVKVN